MVQGADLQWYAMHEYSLHSYYSSYQLSIKAKEAALKVLASNPIFTQLIIW